MGKEINKYIYLFLFQLLFIPVIWISLTRDVPFVDYYEELRIDQTQLIFTSLFLISFLYLFLILKENWLENISVKNLLISISPLLIFLLISPPLLSRDILSYVIPARNAVEFGADPYAVPIHSITQNPWAAYLKGIWEHTSVYGPLFNIYMIILSFFTQWTSNIWFLTFLYKLTLLSIFILSAVVLKKYGDHSGTASKMFLLNPALLLHFILDAHNDALMVFLILIIVLRKNLPAVISFVSSVGIKYFSVILMPLVIFENKKISFKNSLFVVSSLILLIGFSKLIFPSFLTTVQNYDYSFYTRMCLYGCSPFSSLLSLFIPQINHFHIKIILTCIMGLFILFKYLVLSDEPKKFAFWILFVFCFIYLSWLSPWLLAYPISTSMLFNKEKKYVILMLVLTFYSFLRYLGI